MHPLKLFNQPVYFSMYFLLFFSPDDESPVFTLCPADIMAPTDSGLPSAAITWPEPVVIDNSGSVDSFTNATNGAPFGIGVSAIVYTALDEAGNSAQCSFTITVIGKEL